MFEIRHHPITTYTTLKLDDNEVRRLAKEYICRKFMGKAEWIDDEGYLCWDDPDHYHGSISTIRGEQATEQQHVAFKLLKIL